MSLGATPPQPEMLWKALAATGALRVKLSVKLSGATPV